MEESLKSYLDKFGISYKAHLHKAVFTVQESEFLRKQIPGLHSKNLFLEDEKGNFYLVCMNAEKRLDIKVLRKYLKLEKLQFASPEKMMAQLTLTPGSVSIFGMIHAKNTRLVLAADLWRADTVSFHANINTESLELNHENLERFYNSLEAQKEILEI